MYLNNIVSTIFSSKTTEKHHICNTCGDTFKTTDEITRHDCTKQNKPFACEVCPRTFRLLPELKWHRFVHADSTVKCEHCPMTFRTRASLELHKKIAHEKKKEFVCDECEELFDSLSGLKEHLPKHTVNKIYTCEICNKEFEVSEDLEKHVFEHKSIGKKCEYCTDTCINKYNLDVHHKLMCKDVKSAQFIFKTKQFNTHSSDIEPEVKVSRHEAAKYRPKQKRLKKFRCAICSDVFSDQPSLKTHWNKHRRDNSKYMCRVCGKNYRFLKYLCHHLKTSKSCIKCRVVCERFD